MADATSTSNKGNVKRSKWSKVNTYLKTHNRIWVGILMTGLLIETTVFLASFLFVDYIDDESRNMLLWALSLTSAAIISLVLYTASMFTASKDKDEIISEIQQLKVSVESLTKTLNKNHQELIILLSEKLPSKPVDGKDGVISTS